MDEFPQPRLISPGEDLYYRIIPSRFPPVSVFEAIYDSVEEFEIAFELEAMTNTRLRAEAGDIHLLPAEDWVTGPGATPVMAAFTHLGYASRFSDGSYGVYYAANSLETAVKETKYHRAKFLADTNEDDQEVTMRVYTGKILKKLRNLRPRSYRSLFDPDDYTLAQKIGAELRAQGAWGVMFPSVRHSGGLCVGVFRAPAVARPRQGAHLRYVYEQKSRSITQVLRVKSL